MGMTPQAADSHLRTAAASENASGHAGHAQSANGDLHNCRIALPPLSQAVPATAPLSEARHAQI
jgi:hypothetical protein